MSEDAEDVTEYHTECRYPDCQCDRFRMKCTASPLPTALTKVVEKSPAEGKAPCEVGIHWVEIEGCNNCGMSWDEAIADSQAKLDSEFLGSK